MSRRLSFAMKKEIAFRYVNGEIAPVLADEYGIAKSTVRRITEAIHPGFRKKEENDNGRS